MKLDPQLAFYLAHQETIDAWYQLRDRIPSAAHGFFAGLVEPLTALAEGLQPDVHLDVLQESSRVRFVLYRSPWYDGAARSLRVGVGMGWERGDFNTAYAGIWLNRNHAGLSTLEPLLKNEVFRLGLSDYNTRGDDWWPAWRYLKPAQDAYWEHLERFADQIRDTVDHAWHAFAPVVDHALDVAHATERSRDVTADEAH